MYKSGFLVILMVLVSFSLYAQGSEQGLHPYIIRGEVAIDLEPIYAGHVDEEYPLDISAARHRALEETAMYFSAMIYGWSFDYEVGERARQVNENLELKLLGSVRTSDPALRVTDTEIRDMRLVTWTDYHLNDNLQRRMQAWRTGLIRNAQSIGHGPSHLVEYPGWLEVKKIALEDAARAALRASLRGSERNRPKEAAGFISLASFPRYYMESGRWAVSARFRIQFTEVIPFAVH